MTEFTIASTSEDPYIAVISTTGGAICELTRKGRKLIEARTSDSFYHGVVLAPWPNRIRDGKYRYGERSYKTFINEVDKNNSLHGLVWNIEWTLVEKSSDHVELFVKVPASDSYPTDLEITLKYFIDDLGLHSKLISRNVGDLLAPYGVSVHPYIVLDGVASVDEYFFKLDSSEVLEVDADRLLPLTTVPVEKHNFDFREGAMIGERFIDHAFKLTNGSKNFIEIYGKNGEGVRMKFGAESKWVQIHTSDRFGGTDSRKCLAVEPMTCPPDAFNSQIDLSHLAPGDTHTFTWSLQNLE